MVQKITVFWQKSIEIIPASNAPFVGMVHSQIIDMVTYNKNRRNTTFLFTVQIQGTHVEVRGVHNPCTL